ncbi:hypothetical protein N7478_007062 [Penicillium angulare]|uniref:uncharacterized protein n=1 Tax=Penicillium angulare TaxID=116970 RepID=UPI0025416D55|nr:uncharacterized protein N7478_007062 [Penicillium angulare]KAJ5281690.1 hypothetical protein N7478_007062 [Penicillium angulare]
MGNWCRLMIFMKRTQQQIEKAHLLQQGELESAQARARDLEVTVEDFQLKALQPVTSFDVTEEYISHEYSLLYDGLFSWAIDLPDPFDHPSYKESIQAFLRAYGSANNDLDLSNDEYEALWIEPELVAAGLF